MKCTLLGLAFLLVLSSAADAQRRTHLGISASFAGVSDGRLGKAYELRLVRRLAPGVLLRAGAQLTRVDIGYLVPTCAGCSGPRDFPMSLVAPTASIVMSSGAHGSGVFVLGGTGLFAVQETERLRLQPSVQVGIGFGIPIGPVQLVAETRMARVFGHENVQQVVFPLGIGLHF